MPEGGEAGGGVAEFLRPGERCLVLELGGPIAPLAIRSPGGEREDTYSLLMPVRLTA